MRCVVVAVAIASLLLPSSGALAARPKKKTESWVALVHTIGDVPATWAPALQKAAESVTDSRVWLQPPGLSLDEIQLTLGCATWGPTCAGQATALIGADSALVIDVTRDTHGVVVRIDGVSGKGAVVGNGERIEVPITDDGLAIAEAWVIGAIKGARPTVLIVTADLDGTEVLIDNKRVGVTPLTLVNTLAAGEHRLMLRRENRAPLTRPIVVQPGTVNREHGMLAQGPPMKSKPTVGEIEPAPLVAVVDDTGSAPSSLMIAGFGLFGVGTVATIGGIVGAAVNLSRQNDVVDVFGDTGNAHSDLCLDGSGGYTRQSSSSCRTPLVAGEPTPGTESRFEHTERIRGYVNGLRSNASIALVIAGTGAVVAATGLVLGIVNLPGESADAAAVTP